jgi:GTP-binding protein
VSTPTEQIPTVAIVGRPNVGKSTLFNRLIRKRRAITLDTPGITRDPIVEEVVWDGIRLRLVDTGGLGGEAEIALAEQVHRHTVRTAEGADLIVAILDARGGLSPLDQETVALVQRMNVPVIWVANKAEGPAQDEALVEFCRLGIDTPLPVSAEHNLGLGDLRSTITDALEAQAAVRAKAAAAIEAPTKIEADVHASLEDPPVDDRSAGPGVPCRVAIVGRPNVGKSSLLNRVAGTELSLVDDKPGTTRDVVDTLVDRDGRDYLLLDTAGMRRPSKVDEGVERISVRRSLEAVRRAHVVVLMIEPEESLTDQDARIARIAWQEGRALVIVVNKVDLLDASAERERIRAEVYERCPTLGPVAVEFMSVLEGTGVGRMFRAIDQAYSAFNMTIRTSDLNRLVESITERRQPPVISNARLRFFYVTQTASRPPTLTFFCNREKVPTDYSRFMERCVREQVPLEGSPLRLRFRRRDSHDRS